MKNQLAHTGIWIDRNKAVVVSMDRGKSLIIPIFFSGTHPTSNGSGKITSSDGNKITVARAYFEKVYSFLPTEHRIVIIGPDETKFKFREFLMEQNPEISGVQTKVAGHMATYDLVQTIRNHFYSNIT